jgi:hypothetical protein
MAQIPAVVYVGVHIVQGDGGRWLTCPDEEELQVIKIMDGSGGVGASAPQPLLEALSVGEYDRTSCW